MGLLSWLFGDKPKPVASMSLAGARRYVKKNKRQIEADLAARRIKNNTVTVPPLVTWERDRYGKYDDYTWADPPPTKKQFGYAVSLGVPLRDGMKGPEVSRGISDVKDESEPADAGQRQELRKMHAEVPRKLSSGQAERAGEVLHHALIVCPACRKDNDTYVKKCDWCGASFKEVKIRLVFAE
ncbi:MAG: hypothetical protein KF861_10990 [Planctomycetaceae bacterium]|nr:hypothetical protein [Planctomycetaceae bacterium]